MSSSGTRTAWGHSPRMSRGRDPLPCVERGQQIRDRRSRRLRRGFLAAAVSEVVQLARLVGIDLERCGLEPEQRLRSHVPAASYELVEERVRLGAALRE